jgi:triosephosphate isomerase
MRGPLVIGNWKMNGSRHSIVQLLDGISGLGRQAGIEVVVCPPFVYLGEVGARLQSTGLRLGAQHVSEYGSGAYTGEIGAAMLADIGCGYVLVGHSERRALFGADDVRVARQFEQAQGAGLTPVLCIGENAEQRAAGQAWEVLRRQLAAIEPIVEGRAPCPRTLVIAYEPVWAIGTGAAADPQEVQLLHGRIRAVLGAAGRDARILYGGSVVTDNVRALMAQPDIDGVLVGGASLSAEQFTAICELATGS